MTRWRQLYVRDGGTGQGNPGFRKTEASLLTAHESVYVMDNHRLALWCWLRELKDGERCHILHIDQHMDFDPVDRERVPGGTAALARMTVEEYLALEAADAPGEAALHWADYLSWFAAAAPGRIACIDFVTHEPCEFEEHIAPLKTRVPVDECIDLMDETIRQFRRGELSDRLIVNLDVDVLFHQDEETGAINRYCEDELLERVGNRVRVLMEMGVVAAVTVALSPGQCLGWEAAVAGAERFLLGLGLEAGFSRPA